MTVSGSTNFSQTRDQIITDALMGLAVVRPNGTPTSSDISLCSNFLNKMIKAWIGKGIGVWGMTEGTLFLTANQGKYTIPGTDFAGDNVIETTLTSTANGANLVVTSTAGMSANDSIGIELDNNTRQWTTIQTVTDSTGLVLNANVTGTASSGNTVFTYTTAATKAMHISSVRCRIAEGTDIIVYMNGRDQFMEIPSKTQTSTTFNRCYYTAGLTTGDFYVWPVPDNVKTRLKYSYQKLFDDFDASTDTADFPSEWLETITLNLMARIAKIYGKPKDEVDEIKQEAALSLIEMQLWDLDNGSSIIAPGYRDED